MATIFLQRDLVLTLKRETLLNVGILSKLHPLPVDLARQVLKENALVKLTQNVFNHLAYYLVTIVDSHASASLPWPLYDSKTERAYRSDLSSLLSEYSRKGLLAPVMSSYFVNPGCYKVTFLIFQLSQLAVQRVNTSNMNKQHQKMLYGDITEKYKQQKREGFIECIEKETDRIHGKFSNYLQKREIIEKISEIFRKKITEMNEKLSSLKAQEYINDLVDKFVKQNKMDYEIEKKVLELKNVNKSPSYLDMWLNEVDNRLNTLETEWEKKTKPFHNTCTQTAENSQALIARHTGEADKSSFTIEYNQKTDEICTIDLQNQVNSQQKYILKNIAKDGKLSFPNLIRGFLVSISFILKNMYIGNEIYSFNEYLEGGCRNYGEILSAVRVLNVRIMNAENRLQQPSISFNQSIPMKELSEIPPIPDLSDLKMGREYHSQTFFDTFTPMNLTKHQFNIGRKMQSSFTRPLPRSLLITPFHHAPRDEFLKSVRSSRINPYDPNSTQNIHNLSVISAATSRGNETIAECTSGFSKQQIYRLLSTKKSSNSKKYKTERPMIKIKKGGLFNESNFSNESFALIRSHSSPNLFENREKRTFNCNPRSRQLSIMKEDSPTLEVSGIAAFERDTSHSTPQDAASLGSRKLDSSSMPTITITATDNSNSSIAYNENINTNKEVENGSTKLQNNKISPPHINWKEDLSEMSDVHSKIETPKTNAPVQHKTSSLEKIINRFKKVRASVMPTDTRDEELSDFRTIVEEKENLNVVNVDVFAANRILLPDLLSPSCNLMLQKSTEDLDESMADVDKLSFDSDKPRRNKPRESLGTALGVDQTFLDQFDLVD